MCIYTYIYTHIWHIIFSHCYSGEQGAVRKGLGTGGAGTYAKGARNWPGQLEPHRRAWAYGIGPGIGNRARNRATNRAN